LLEWVDDNAIRSVNASLMEMAREEGAEYLDIYTPFSERGGPGEYLMPDGVHINEKGYALWAGKLEEIIEPTGKA
jgi:lysophospholipase L1-like esterase